MPLDVVKELLAEGRAPTLDIVKEPVKQDGPPPEQNECLTTIQEASQNAGGISVIL